MSHLLGSRTIAQLKARDGWGRNGHRFRGIAGVVLLGALLLGALPADDARAALIVGTNPELEETDGGLFVPQKGRTSGVLGEQLNPRRRAGLKRDRIFLPGPGAKRRGDISFVLAFDLTPTEANGLPFSFGDAEAPGDNLIDADSATLAFSLEDLDFQPVRAKGARYRETMEIRFLRNADDSIFDLETGELLPGDVMLDKTNYGLFEENYAAGAFPSTNNVTRRYVLSMTDDLGMTTEDFEAVLDDLEFALLVTVRSETKRRGGGASHHRSTREYIRANDFTFETAPTIEPPIPEPATVSLLAAGAAILIGRRRGAVRRQ